jgi:hypothetical protein
MGGAAKKTFLVIFNLCTVAGGLHAGNGVSPGDFHQKFSSGRKVDIAGS